jgi:hypothetical protein
LRLGAPNTSASVAKQLPVGTTLTVLAVVPGEAVSGVTSWYQVDPNIYLWTKACGPLTPTAGAGAVNTSAVIGAMGFVGSGAPLTQAGLDASLVPVGTTASALWAVLSVETSGCGFLSDRRPKILFERHIFHRLTGGKWDNDDPDVSSPKRGGYGSAGAHQYVRLQAAMQLDANAALQSASWGLGQIMGENFAAAGFDSVQGMVNAFVTSEDAQLLGMANFIRSSNMAPALQSRDWSAFARLYNGADYAAHNYDGQLGSFYARFSSSGLPDLTVRACQAYLNYKGFAPGPIDGVAGVATVAAAKAYQAANGIDQNGVVDAALLTALAA